MSRIIPRAANGLHGPNRLRHAHLSLRAATRQPLSGDLKRSCSRFHQHPGRISLDDRAELFGPDPQKEGISLVADRLQLPWLIEDNGQIPDQAPRLALL